MKTKQMRVIRLLTMAMISFFTTTCVNHIPEEPTILSPSEIPINISTNISCAQSRISNNKFENDDAIGLYVTSESQSLNESRYIDNMRFTCTAEGLIPDEEVFYPSGNNKFDFISYYPYQKKAIATNTSNIKIAINANQSSPSGYSVSDFMVAKVTGVSASTKSVKLDFEHKLCQLNIVLKLTENENIQEIKKSAAVFISNACTQATYDFNTNEFSAHNTPQQIVLNGDWIINEEKKELTGKKILLIPQQANNYEIILHINGSTFSSPLPDDLVIASNKSSKAILTYTPQIGISKLEPSICEWEEGNSKNIPLKEQSTSIRLAELNFGQTGVHQIMTASHTVVAEVCKEYLLGSNIDDQAIVLYPAATPNKGTVLQLLNASGDMHGGSLAWDISSNSFTYTAGSSAPITTLYVNAQGDIVFEKPTDPQIVTAIGNVLTDTRGTETLSYPIIKIGMQYWMGENLNTTRYNDGKSTITKITDLTKATAGYFLKENNRYYNQAAVIKGTLAPKGWKIPTNTEWEMLKKYVNNTSSVLKAGTQWTASSGIDKANNKTGFNAQPIGFYAKIKDSNSSKYVFNNEYVAYWSMGSSQTLLSEKAISLKYNFETIEGATHNEYSGYSIRCIKE